MRRKSFSLIEFLIVIVIIGILLTIAISVSNSTRMRARDTKRKQDLQSIKLAIVNYKSERNIFPVSSNALCSSAPGNDNSRWILLETRLAPYLNPFPTDPQGGKDTTGTCRRAISPWIGNGLHAYEYTAQNVAERDIQRWSVWTALENTRDADRNGVTGAIEAYSGNYRGKYKNLFYYVPIVVAAAANSANDNAANIYGVGCIISNFSDPASPCRNQ